MGFKTHVLFDLNVGLIRVHKENGVSTFLTEVRETRRPNSSRTHPF